jgi:hypothetical protein
VRRLLAALVLLAASAWAADDVPGWLKDLPSAPLPKYDAKVNTVVLYNEEHTVVGDNGKLATTTRTALKFLTRQGTDARFLEQYDTGGDKVKDFRAWMIAPSGKVKKYGKDEIVDVACAENDVYNECRRRVVSGRSDADIGAVFAYEATVERQTFSGQLIFRFQDALPVRTARFLVTVPAGWELKSASFNGAPREAAPAGGTYNWEMTNLPAIEPEPASPSVMSLVPWTGVTLLGKPGAVLSWTEAARLLAGLNEGVAEPNDVMAGKARDLTKGAASELDKIRAIGRFVQQINYVSVQVNIGKGGGYRPHAAPQVFQHLYGDCKDKANLVRAMLKAVGITAYPVAIYSGDRTHVVREWPSLGAFNHAISAIRVGADTSAPAILDHPRMGRLLFFDSTDPYTPAGYLPDHEQASLALVGMPEAGDLVQVPAARSVASARERTVEAALAADGSFTGSFVDKRSGEELPDAVARYRGGSKTEYIKGIERWVGRGVPGANTTDVEITDESGAFTVKGKFAAPRYAQMPQARMLIFRAAPLRHFEGLWLTEKTRKYPVEIDADALSETVKIALPAGFRVDETPDAVHLDTRFGKYDASWTVEGATLLFRRTLEVQAQSVPVAEYGELRKFLDGVNGSGAAPVVLVRQ